MKYCPLARQPAAALVALLPLPRIKQLCMFMNYNDITVTTNFNNTSIQAVYGSYSSVAK
jgi:hypothetical protein